MKENVFFVDDDIKARIDLCQSNMEKRGLNGLVVSAESNVNYYANYYNHAPWTTFTRPLFLFIPLKGKPYLLAQTFVAPEAKAVTHCCEVLEFKSLLGPTTKEIADIMHNLGMNKGNIAFEMGFEQRIGFQLDTFLSLKNYMTDASFVDGSDLIWNQRLIKSEKEIECHRRACAATSYAHDHVFPQVKKGMTEFEISQLVQIEMLKGGAEYPGFVIITSGEENYSRISKINTDRKIEDGDLLWLDLGARYKGYWSDFCRAGIVGEISDERNRLQNAIHEVTMRAAEIMKPGVPVKEVAFSCGKELEKYGFEATFDCGRMGHGMGLMSTEPPSVTIYDDTILQEGMIINLEPGVINSLGVFDIEENFVITKNGYECLSGGSRNLHRIF